MAHSDFFIKLSENHPFITVCVYAGQEYVGVIQNRDDAITTIYDYGAIVESELKNKFLELGDTWWWELDHSHLIPPAPSRKTRPFQLVPRTYRY